MAGQTITIKVVLDEKDVQSGAKRIENALSQAARGGGAFGDAESKLAAFGKTITAVGIAAGAAAVGGLALMAKKAVDLAADLQQSVAKISSIKPEIDTRQVFQALNEMSTRIPQSAEQLGDALYDVFSSINVTQKEGLQLVEQFAKGATAAATDAKTFGTAVVGVMNAYKLSVDDAAHVQDVFFNTVKNGVVTGEELANSLGPVAQAAKAAGLSVDELGGFIAAVTKEGGPAAQNINNLNNFLLKILTPSKEAAEQFKALGISLKDSSTGGVRPMIEVLEEMRGKLAGLSEFERNQTLAKLFPDAQALTGARVLLSQLDNVKQFTDANAKSAGAAREAYEKMANTWNTQSELLKNTTLAILRQLGAEILPLLTPALKAIAQELPNAIEVIKRTIAALKQAWTENWGGIRDVTLKVTGEIRKFANDNLDAVVKWWKDNLPLIKQTVQTTLNAMREFWREHGKEITEVVKNAWEVLKAVVGTAGRVLGDTLKLIMQIINGDWRGAWHSIWDIVKDVFSGIIGTIKGLGNAFNAAVKLLVERSIEIIKGMASGMYDAGAFLVTGLLEGLKGGWNKVTGWAKSAANSIVGIFNKDWKIQSPSKVFEQIGIFAGEGLAEGFEASRTKVSAAAKKIAKEAEKIVTDHGVEMVRAYRKSQEEIADVAERIAKDLAKLHEQEKELAADSATFAAQAARQWANERKEVELTLDSYEYFTERYREGQQRIRDEQQRTRDDIARIQGENAQLALNSAQRQQDAYKLTQESIRQEHLRSAEVIGAAQARIADNAIYHSDTATAAILGHLAKQRSITETVADSFISLYDNAFGKLNSLIDGWTSKLGVFGDFVGTLLKGIVNNIANSILGNLFGPQGVLGKVMNGLGNVLNNAIGGILSKIPGLSGLAGGGATGGAGGILGGILGGTGAGGNAGGGILGGVLGGIFGTGAVTSTATTGAFAGATATGTVAAGTGGLSGILGSVGAFASTGLGIATLGIGTAAAIVGSILIKRAKQRRNDEEASGVALQDAVDLIKATATSIDSDQLRFTDANESQGYLNDAILKPFKDFINTLKTKSVKDSRLTNQVTDLENLYNQLVGDAIKRQQERLAAAAASTTATTSTTTTGTGGTTPDPFANLAPTTVTIEELKIEFLVGTDAASKVAVTGIKTKEGQKVVVETVKIATENGEL